jgi:hypothetical protein
MTNKERDLVKVDIKIQKETQLSKIAWKAMTAAMLKP